MALVYSYPPLNRAVQQTGCYLTAIGRLRQSAREKYPPGVHPREFNQDWNRGRLLADAILLFIVDGAGEWESRHGKGTLKEGDLFYIPPNTWHRYRPIHAIGWHEKWLCLRGATVHQYIRQGVLSSRMRVLQIDAKEEIESRLDRFLQDVLAQPQQNLPSWGARALSILLEAFEEGSVLPKPAANKYADAWKNEALHFIRHNSHRAIAVEDVAEVCGRTRRSVERFFREENLGSVAEAIAAERMERAKLLLRTTSLSVKEVAAESGFNSAQHFIVTFKRLEKMTPGDYRNQEKNH